MLGNARVEPVIPVSDIERAIDFYEGKLGLSIDERFDEIPENPSVRFRAGETFLEIYRSVGAGESRATIAGFEVDDIETVVDGLRKAGVAIEDYDLPGLKTEGGIANLGSSKGAWFRDPDGNILSVLQRVRVGAGTTG
jgi:catechol 2,3-dioxygenase-like lactoylglutathione lyase family enzyme